MGYSFRLSARVLYAPTHIQDSTCHGLCCTSRGALAGTRNSFGGEECLHHYSEGERRLLMSRDRNLEKAFMGRCLTNQLLVCSGQPLTKGEYTQRQAIVKVKKEHVCKQTFTKKMYGRHIRNIKNRMCKGFNFVVVFY